jgi:hypothetical protein
LIEWGVYEEVKRSFVNCSATFLRNFYDKIDEFNAFEYLHNKYRTDIFKKLDISNKSKEYFYDKYVYDWCMTVENDDAKHIAFKCARAYGNNLTTAILRFQFPYNLVKRNSKLILYGAGLLGRSYYAQLMLSSWADVVLWCEKENSADLHCISNPLQISSTQFDNVLIAYATQNQIDKAINVLRDVGIPNNKILYNSR